MWAQTPPQQKSTIMSALWRVAQDKPQKSVPSQTKNEMAAAMSLRDDKKPWCRNLLLRAHQPLQ